MKSQETSKHTNKLVLFIVFFYYYFEAESSFYKKSGNELLRYKNKEPAKHPK
jgi:hypothetical protein